MWKHVCKLILVKQFTVSTRQALVYKHSLILSCHHRASGWSKSSRQVWRQSVFTKFCVASCHCCHDPFIVRSAQTRPPFTGCTQLAHPSRCSRSTLETVCFCALVSVILLWSVGSIVSRIPILQTCNVVVVLKQRLASFQHLRSSSLKAPS